jgi:glucan endo-1,3-alpha-glucosidase
LQSIPRFYAHADILQPATGGNACGVTGNSASHGQSVFTPDQILQDAVFFSALLTAPSQITAQIGGGPIATYSGVAGINTFSLPFNGNTGVPVITIANSGLTSSSSPGPAIGPVTGGCENYNAWVGGV